MINEAQLVVLETIKITRINNFDGEVVEKWLMQNETKYTAALLTKDRILTILRDLPKDCYNADTIYISTASMEDAREIKRVAKEEWHCSEVDILDNEMRRSLRWREDDLQLIRIWWD